jgi:hypothetical protein
VRSERVGAVLAAGGRDHGVGDLGREEPPQPPQPRDLLHLVGHPVLQGVVELGQLVARDNRRGSQHLDLGFGGPLALGQRAHPIEEVGDLDEHGPRQADDRYQSYPEVVGVPRYQHPGVGQAPRCDREGGPPPRDPHRRDRGRRRHHRDDGDVVAVEEPDDPADEHRHHGDDEVQDADRYLILARRAVHPAEQGGGEGDQEPGQGQTPPVGREEDGEQGAGHGREPEAREGPERRADVLVLADQELQGRRRAPPALPPLAKGARPRHGATLPQPPRLGNEPGVTWFGSGQPGQTMLWSSL